MKKQEIIAELVKALETLKEDAQMALDGRWDKSDEGFRDQIDLIDLTLDKVS